MKIKEQIELAIKWIDTLDTTNLPQTKYELGNSHEGYCCLGIGCVITNTKYSSGDGSSEDFAKKVGLRQEEGYPLNETDYSPLIHLNDEYMDTFKEIAKVLKDVPEQYFIEKVAEGIREYYKTVSNA